MNEHEFQHAGLDCKVVLTGMGHHCGYVAVPPSHPWFGRGYTDKVSVPDEIVSRSIDVEKVGLINMICASDTQSADALEIVLAIDVHGGLTFAARDKGRDLWWFGFDCAHYGDGRHIGETDWRDLDYAAAECRSLAEQLTRIAGLGKEVAA